jgi:hypothetical protein
MTKETKETLKELKRYAKVLQHSYLLNKLNKLETQLKTQTK